MFWGSVFPGQGAQHIGMGRFLFDNFKEAKILFEEASDTLSLDFKKLCFTGVENDNEEDLNLTKNTQPALLLVSTATYNVIQEIAGFKATASAGHSVGEYAALVTSGSIKFTHALRAVRTRGEAMQAAVPLGEGSMCAVLGLTDQQVREVCLWVEKESALGPLEPANFNSPGQVVISGKAAAIEWLQANFKTEILTDTKSTRAKFIPLKVSAPFHCSLMKPAEDKMREVLATIEFAESKNPIVQNFTAQPTTDPKNLRENLIRQISSPVLWAQCVEKISTLGITHLVECGPGKVLSGLIKKISNDKVKTFNLNSLEDIQRLECDLKAK